MQITYLNHSSFFIRESDQAMLIDYGKLPLRAKTGDLLEGVFQTDIQFQTYKNLIGYSSHRHEDHFDAKLIKLFLKNDFTYILSDEADFPVEEYMNHSCFYRLLPRSRKDIDNLKIANTGSTDQGGAILFQNKNKNFSFYYGGDLAIWADMEVFRQGFAEEFKWLKQELVDFAPVKVAFLPSGTSDGYQEKPLLEGSRDLIELLKPEIVIPMHGYGYPEYYPSFAKEMKKRVKSLSIQVSCFAEYSSRSKVGDSVTIVFPEKTGESIVI